MKRVTIFLLAAMLTLPAWADEERVPVCPCPVTCPSGAIVESEQCGGPWNNGCTIELRTIACGNVICGASKVTETYRDTDWFRISVTDTDSVLLKWKVVAEFDVTIRIMGPGPIGCSDRLTYAEVTALMCSTAVASACVDSGVYWLEVTPASTVSLLACSKYLAEVTCSPCPPPEPPCPSQPPMLIAIGQRFCLEFCGRPIKVYWCCPFDGPPVFVPDGGTLPWTVQEVRWDSSNVECPAPGGWWSAEFVAEDTGRVCVLFDRQLVVELGTFDAIPGENRITLRWNTLSESNNDRFDVERDGAVVARPRSLGDSPSGHSYEWVDENVQSSVTHTYKLYSVDLNGTRRELATASATPTSGPAAVTEYALDQNYPNPFNPTTQIIFDIVENGPVMLTVFNPVGQMVTTLVNGPMTAGRHVVTFDASGLPTGMYLYRLEAGSFTAAHKMLLIK